MQKYPPPEDIAELAAEIYRRLQEFVPNINNIEKNRTYFATSKIAF